MFLKSKIHLSKTAGVVVVVAAPAGEAINTQTVSTLLKCSSNSTLGNVNKDCADDGTVTPVSNIREAHNEGSTSS